VLPQKNRPARPTTVFCLGDYFDHNATAPVIREAREAWLEATEHKSGQCVQPASNRGRANAALREAREKRLARFSAASRRNIVGRAGNRGKQHGHAPLRADARCQERGFGFAIEHRASRMAKHYLANAPNSFLVTHDGVLTDWLRAPTRPGLVGIMAANNETGVIQPWYWTAIDSGLETRSRSQA